MFNIQPISFSDVLFLGRNANAFMERLNGMLEEMRIAINEGPKISGDSRSIGVDKGPGGYEVKYLGSAREEGAPPGGNAIIVRVERSPIDPGDGFIPPKVPAKYKYRVTALDGTFIADPVSQIRRRILTNLIPGGPYGIGFYEDEEFKLWDAGETPVVFVCEPTEEQP